MLRRHRRLSRLRILIVHAGGDSRRLPAYAPCGKIFVPLPADSDAPLPVTLFDRLVPDFLALPPGCRTRAGAGGGRRRADPVRCGPVSFAAPGIIALGCHATPEEASRHGVFCIGADGAVSRVSAEAVRRSAAAEGAIDPARTRASGYRGHDIDAAASAALLAAFGVALALPARSTSRRSRAGGTWITASTCTAKSVALWAGRDPRSLYRSARKSGSTWPESRWTRAFRR